MEATKWLVVLLTLSQALAGCIGATGDDEAVDGDETIEQTSADEVMEGASDGTIATDVGEPDLETPAEDEEAATEPVMLEPFAFAASGPLTATLVEAGSFQLYEGCRYGICQEDPTTGETMGRVVYDITTLLPRGVPTTIRVTTDWTDPPYGNIWLAIDGPDEFLAYETTFASGVSTATAELVPIRDGPTTVTVRYVNQGADTDAGQAQQVDYTMTVDVVGRTDIVPLGVPVTVPLAGSGASFGVASEAGADVAVWSPHDAFLGRFTVGGTNNTAFDVPSGQPSGDYVVVVLDSDGPVQLEPRTIRPLSFELSALDTTVFRSEPTTSQIAPPEDPAAGPQPTARASYVFGVERVPLAVGAYVKPAPGPYVYEGMAVTVSSPSGAVATWPDGWNNAFGVAAEDGPAAEVWSAVGEPNLVPGEYTLEFGAVSADDFQVGHMVREYVR